MQLSGEVSLKRLRGEPYLLLRDGHCLPDNALSACNRAPVTPKVVFESGQLSSLLGLVGAGMGVSLIPDMAVQKSANCRYVCITDGAATRTIGAVVLRGRSVSRAHHAFLGMLRGDRK